ncbi:hypothetical protein AURDEDRAFT_136618 [Auricularia subglabra TFB-10046 SS5]|nr:hypothetical protein AURDEDRAFT_136618 [Auricularia subglabra TFB-10046 SS5]
MPAIPPITSAAAQVGQVAAQNELATALGLSNGIAEAADGVVKTIVNADAAGRVAILGGPGMGKTSLAVSALYQPAVILRFGERRYFVSCDAAEGGSSMHRLLAEAIGTAAPDERVARKALQAVLGVRPSLLVLDNFESAWEELSRRQDAEDLLCFLDSLSDLSLIVTMRGSERPHGPRWSRPFLPPLAPLGHSSARQTFLAIADVFDADTAIDALLRNLDNIPLALVLMGNLAQSEPISALLQRWDDLQTSMLVRGDGQSKTTSLDFSIQISIQSPRMQAVPPALTLLAILSLLPCGAMDSDIMLWGIPDAAELIAVLLRTSLAVREDQRISVLAPIRTFILANHGPSGPGNFPSKHCLYKHFFGLAALANDSRSERMFNHELFASVVPELANIDAVVRHAFSNRDSNLEEALQAAVYLCNLKAKIGLGPGMDLLPLALRVARNNGFMGLEAQLLYRWARLSYDGTMPGDPRALYSDSRELFERAGDSEGLTRASLRLLRFVPPREAIAEGRHLYQLSEQRQSLEGMAASCHEIGYALHRDGRVVEAISEHQLGVSVIDQQVKPGRLAVTNKYQLAECYRAVTNITGAVSLYLDALTIAKSASLPHNVNIIHTQLADTFLCQGKLGDAIDHASQALAVQNIFGFRNNIRASMILAFAHTLAGCHDDADRAMERIGDFEPPDGLSALEQCRILRTRGIMAWKRGNLADARALLGAAKAIARLRDSFENPEYMLAAETSIIAYLGEVESSAGNKGASSILAISSAVLYRSMTRSSDVPRALLVLAQSVEDDFAEKLLEAVMLPMLHCGSTQELGSALIQSAEIAWRRGDLRLAVKRARNALIRFGDVKDERSLRIARRIIGGIGE